MKLIHLTVLAVGLVASAARAETVVNQASADTTLLTATLSATTLGSVLDVHACAFVSEDHGVKTYDCKSALAAATGAVVIANRVELQVGTDPFGHEYILDDRADTPLVDVSTLTRTAAFDHATDLGFFYDQGGYNFTYDKSQLVEIGRAKLKDGSDGVIHRFVVPFFPTGWGNSGPIRGFCVKPFADFVAGETRYRNWDLAPGSGQGQDHCLIEGYEPYMPDHTAIDRRAELLE